MRLKRFVIPIAGSEEDIHDNECYVCPSSPQHLQQQASCGGHMESLERCKSGGDSDQGKVDSPLAGFFSIVF